MIYATRVPASSPFLAEGAVIVLFTDFGVNGPYNAQIKALMLSKAPGVDVIDLFADAPAYDPQAAAYLLAAYVGEFATGHRLFASLIPGCRRRSRSPRCSGQSLLVRRSR